MQSDCFLFLYLLKFKLSNCLIAFSCDFLCFSIHRFNVILKICIYITLEIIMKLVLKAEGISNVTSFISLSLTKMQHV